MDLEISGPLALLSIRTGKANAIGPTFLDRLSSQLDVLERSGARALVMIWGAAIPAARAAAKSRLVSFIKFLPEAGLPRRPFLVLASSSRTRNRVATYGLSRTE